MREIRINCPHCHRKSKLFLTSRPYLMVLNCPVCHHSLLNSEGKTYEIDDMKIIQMKGPQIESFIKGLKKQLAKQNSQSDYANNHLPVNTQQDVYTHSSHRKKEPVRTSPVSKDDLINLKIALESCRDVSDFLKMI